MKSSPAFCLVVLALTVFAQFGASYTTHRIQGGEEGILATGGTVQANGSFLNITEDGLMNVVLQGNGLVFELCTMNCNADVLICYDGDTPSRNAADLCDSKCGIFITGRGNEIMVRSSSASVYEEKEKLYPCDIITMENGEMLFRRLPFTSCAPKIENGMIKLNVSMASSDCPLLIKDAYILPETTTAPPSTKTSTMSPTLEHNFSTTAKGGVSGAGNGTNTEEASFMDNYWWIILIVCIVLIVAGIVAGVLIYYFKCKKAKKPTTDQPPAPKEKGKRPPLPPSVMNPPSILSQKSLLDINGE